MPLVTGRLLPEAKELISAAGLTLNTDITYKETEAESLHGRVPSQAIAAHSQVILGTNISRTVYRVPSLMKKAKITLDLPASEALTSVRVTLQDESGEYTVYQNDYPANASRHPEIELTTDNAGTYTYRGYINDTFKYSGTVTFE